MPRHAQRNLFKIALACVMILSSVLGLGGFSPAQAGPAAQVTTASPNGLVINEVADSQNVASEYFELYNTSAITINLSSYVIYNRDGNNPLSTLANPLIGPGQFRVIGPSQLGRPTIAGSGLATIDFLGLRNTSPSDQIIDVVNWGGAPDPGWPNYELFACCFFNTNQPTLIPDNPKDIQRWPDGQDTDVGTDWAQIERSPGAPSCGDPFEDDDTLSTPFLQNSGTTTLHRICAAGDSDFIRIDVSPSFTYTLQANAVGSRVDTLMRLYDAAGNLIAENDPGTSRDSQISFRPAAQGSFRAQVVDSTGQGSNGFDFLYNFTITQQSAASPTPSLSVTPTPIACEDQYEPDNVFPTQAKVLELNTEQVHTFCRQNSPQGDVDWLLFVASAGKIYTFYTKDLAGPTDTVLSLQDSDGSSLYDNDDYQPGTSLASRIDWSFTRDGVYYLAVREKRGGNSPAYRYTVGVSTTGQLPPSMTPSATATLSPFSPTPTSGPCYDGFEPDGVPETARIIYIGQTQRHNVCPVTDADWVKFYGRAGKAYTIATTNLGIGLDTYMWIFDSDATTIVAYNDDGGNGVASRIDFVPLKDDFYYVQVKNAGDLGLPEMTYELSLAVTPPPPQPPSTATGIVAPAVTVTPGTGDDGVSTPTTIVLPTKPPVNTPTQGVIPPTPEVPEPVATNAGGEQPAPTQPAVEPTKEPDVPPTEPPVVEPTPELPGVPVTGGRENVPVIEAISQPPAVVRMAPMLFRVFFDRNGNQSYNANEGIRGVSVFFLDATTNYAPTASLLTSEVGEGRLQVPVSPQQVYIPYFNIFMPLTRFPERELHSIWLPPVKLPQSVP
ncbi:MAG: pre-peptidase C-terminal domain-containing protein [Chloroflexia bacterium]